MKKIILFLFFISFHNCQGQNYRVFEWNVPHFFEGPNYIKAIMVDSVDVINGDSTFYNFFSIDINHPDSNWCTNIFGPSWIGQKIIIPSDSLNILFTYEGDSIFIRPLDTVGSSWRMMEIDSLNHLLASITAIGTQIINGTPDSIKTINLLATNNISGLPVSNLLNNKNIILSKNHGFVQLLPFRDLPGDTSVFVLNDSLGLTHRDVYDFDIGDTIQYEYYYCPPGSSCNPTNYKTKVVTNKTLLPQNIVQYDLWVQDVIQSLITDSTGTHLVTNISVTTSMETYAFDDTLVFSTMPEETDTFNPGIANRYLMTRGSCGMIRAYTISGDYNFNPNLNCFFTFEPDIDELGYISGLGLASTSHYGCTPCGNYSNINRINSFRKAASGCGGILHIFNKVEEISNNDFKIYPNPLGQSEYLFIEKESHQKVQFTLFDITGKKIIQRELSEMKSTIDLRSIAVGYYLYQLVNSSNEVVTGRIIK